MLTIVVGGTEVYDESTQLISMSGGVKIQLEHSLVSISKWESEFEKPFLSKESKTQEEILAYIQCMIVGTNPPEDFLHHLSKAHLEEINTYIGRKMTATWFRDVAPKAGNKEIITSELIYYWLVTFQIPFECQTWHLNRLFTLIRVCNEQQSPPKKMTPGQIAARNRELNAQRKAQLGTRG